jgi:thymidylate kinase
MSNHHKAKRIIITGASGVGKTTLVELLAPLLSLPIIPEVARVLCKELGYDKIGDIPDQEGFKRKVLQRQIEEENRLGTFISDRSALDSWVLWQRWNICQAMTFDTEIYYGTARSQASAYTDIIYVPPMFPPPNDGFRWIDTDYQRQIDRIVRMTLHDWELWGHTYVVRAANVEARVKEVMQWLEERFQ